MTASLRRAAPVRFLIGVIATWVAVRGVALAGWSPSATVAPSPQRLRPAPAASVLRQGGVPLPLQTAALASTPLLLRADTLQGRGAAYHPQTAPHPAAVPLHAPDARGEDDTRLVLLAASLRPAAQVYRRATGLAEAATTIGEPATDKRWSASAWAFLRGGGRASSLSPGGQIGGGQAGARILYHLDGPLSAAARVSTAIGGMRQTEAAVGLDWKPAAGLPVHLMAERRIAIDRGGRNAWTLGAAGGVDDVRIAPGWRLDGYGEAGVVGAHRRDLYADGAARIARAIDLGPGKTLALGGGAWGAAQPGAARLDVGPSVVLRLPIDHHSVALALDWRERVLGRARPGSGAALTIATDF